MSKIDDCTYIIKSRRSKGLDWELLSYFWIKTQLEYQQDQQETYSAVLQYPLKGWGPGLYLSTFSALTIFCLGFIFTHFVRFISSWCSLSVECHELFTIFCLTQCALTLFSAFTIWVLAQLIPFIPYRFHLLFLLMIQELLKFEVRRERGD